MSFTSRALAVLVLLVSCSVFAAETRPQSSAPSDSVDFLSELLPRVAESEERLHALYDSSTFVVSTSTTKHDARGRKVEGSEVDTRMFPRDGKPWEEIVRWVEDGKDVTRAKNAKRQKELASGKRTREDAMPFRSPFLAARQALHRFRDLGAVEGDPSRRRVGFSPRKGKAGKNTSRGEAEVDVTRGAIVSMTIVPSELPPFADEAEIHLEMAHETPAGPALSRVVVHGAGSLLFVKRTLKADARISAYERIAAPRRNAGL